MLIKLSPEELEQALEQDTLFGWNEPFLFPSAEDVQQFQQFHLGGKHDQKTHAGARASAPKHLNEYKKEWERPAGQMDSPWGDDPATNPGAAARQKLEKWHERHVTKEKDLAIRLQDAQANTEVQKQMSVQKHRALTKALESRDEDRIAAAIRDRDEYNNKLFDAMDAEEKATVAYFKHRNDYLVDARKQLWESPENRSDFSRYSDSTMGAGQRHMKRNAVTESSKMADEFVNNTVALRRHSDKTWHGGAVPPPDIRYDPQSGRSYYQASAAGGRGGITIMGDASRSPTTKVHEMGHHIERSVGSAPASGAFVDRRRTGPDTPMRDLTRNPSYDAHEQGTPDKFIDGYSSKRYSGDGSSELLSMGMQHMYEDPVRFARADPSHFDYTYRVVKGYEFGTASYTQ